MKISVLLLYMGFREALKKTSWGKKSTKVKKPPSPRRRWTMFFLWDIYGINFHIYFRKAEKPCLVVLDKTLPRFCKSGVLPFSCNICQKQFAGANNLANHILVHQGDTKAVICAKCGKQFRKPGSHAKDSPDAAYTFLAENLVDVMEKHCRARKQHEANCQ